MEHLKLYEEFFFIDEKKEKQKSIDKVKDEVSNYTKENTPINISIKGDDYEEASLKINGALNIHPKIILSVEFPKGYDNYVTIVDELNLQTITIDGHEVGVDDISINDSTVGHIYVRRKEN